SSDVCSSDLEVGAVVEQLVHQTLVDQLAFPDLAALRGPGFRRHAVQPQLLDQHRAGAELDETAEDVADQLGLAFVWDQPAVLDVVAKWRHAAHPHALALAGGDL